ncbi:MAG: glycosyltransferase [Solirubrobacterales bacterium]
MRICFVSSERSPWGGIGHSLRNLTTLLASRHEVTLIHSGADPAEYRPEPAPGVREVFADLGELANVAFACDDHRRSAAALAAIELAYEGSEGPDYLEVCDYRAHGLVALQARRAGNPLLKDTLVGVRLASTVELISLHDGATSAEARLVSDLEREQFRLADRVLWHGGDTLDLYRRYYSDLEFPEAVRIRPPLEVPVSGLSPPPSDPGGPLKLLYVGRLQRSKGAIDLVEACLGLPLDEWELTMIGVDTATAPVGQSVRATIEALCGEDPRVRLVGLLSHEELQRHFAAHDLLVIPSRFEPWSSVAIEAMRGDVPILATPVGGAAEIVDPGVTGWHTDGLGPEALARALSGLLEDREAIERIRSSGAVRERVRALTGPHGVLAAYEQIAEDGSRIRSSQGEASYRSATSEKAEPLVSAVVPYYRSFPYAEDAVSSLLHQTHRNLEVLIVNDGSFEPGDEILARLSAEPRVTVVTQLNKGEAGARNLGARLATGKYLAMLDADNAFEPEFVSRAVAILEREPELAYVTCWLNLVDPDDVPTGQTYVPLGNSVPAEDTINLDGDTIAVIPRRLFADLGYHYEPISALQSDWELYRSLRGDGRFGVVIPESLARYRVVPESLSRTHDGPIRQRSWDEARARLRLRGTRWTAEG